MGAISDWYLGYSSAFFFVPACPQVLGQSSLRQNARARMTDPSNAMQSFQQALLRGGIQLRRGVLDPDLYVYVDKPNGQPRFTYVRLNRKTVTAFVEFAWCEPIEGTPCLAIGYAVPENIENRDAQRKLSSRQYQRCNTDCGGTGFQCFMWRQSLGLITNRLSVSLNRSSRIRQSP